MLEGESKNNALTCAGAELALSHLVNPLDAKFVAPLYKVVQTVLLSPSL